MFHKKGKIKMDLAICKYCWTFWDNLSYFAGLIDTVTFVLVVWYLRKIYIELREINSEDKN